MTFLTCRTCFGLLSVLHLLAAVQLAEQEVQCVEV